LTVVGARFNSEGLMFVITISTSWYPFRVAAGVCSLFSSVPS
jgi:hypothetical protein